MALCQLPTSRTFSIASMSSSILSKSAAIPSKSSSILSKSAAIPSRSTLVDAESPIIQFTTIEELFKQIDYVTGDLLTVQGVSPEDFAKIDNERGARRRKFRLRRYEAKSKILIITIPAAPHEELHLELNMEIFREIDRMGLGDDWKQVGGTTFHRQRYPGGGGGGDGGGGEGDSSGRPRSQRRGDLEWPTLVIEAGYSQSLEGLRACMRWWFDASNHEVKIVLLAKLQKSQGEIILEKWLEVASPSRPGATTTRAASQSSPVCRQTIRITRALGITNTDPNRFNPTSYIVTSGALRLEFDQLFLRQPGQGEGDVIVSIPRLQLYAVKVWEGAG